MYGHVPAEAMPIVITLLKDNRLIDAIKQFRLSYNVGLKEAKDAVEAIRDVMGYIKPAPSTREDGFMVVSYFDNGDWSATMQDSLSEAEVLANGIVNNRDETYVCRVLAKSKVTKSMVKVD